MIGPKSSGLERGKHHDRPPGLAVADHGGLAFGIGMQLNHALEKGSFGACDVLDRLPRHRLGQEADEVARVTGPEGNADLALRFEAADAGAVSGARIDDDERPLLLVYLDGSRRRDADQNVVDRSRQLAPIHDELAAELQHMGGGLRVVLSISLAALLQDVQHEDAALPRINPIGPRILDQIS